MRNLVFYDGTQTQGSDPELRLEDLKNNARRATTDGQGAMLFRDVNQWRGELEVAENRYPDTVFLVGGSGGNSSVFDKVRKAYEEVGVEVQDGDPNSPLGSKASSSDEGDDDLAGLKAEATALGIPFNSATNDDDLKAKVDQTRVEQAAKASLLAGQGRAQEVNATVNRNNARVGAGDANARAGNLDPANMATTSEDGVQLTGPDGEEAREVGNADQPREADIPEDGDIEALRAMADEEGVEYASNIGYSTLRTRILQKRAEGNE